MLVETNLGRIYVEVQGEGPPLLLWHSLLCNGGMWRRIVPALAKRFRVINVDGPGHGRSAPCHQAYDLMDCTRVAEQVLDELDVRETHWLGLSWGGMTGMRFALRCPERLKSLVLLDTSAAAEEVRKLPSYRVMSLVAVNLGPLRILLDQIEPIFFAAETRQQQPAIVRRFREELAAMDQQSLRSALDAVIFGRDDVTAALAALTVPTMVGVGSEDVATPPTKSYALCDAIAGASLFEFPNAGHLSPLEQPESVLAALTHFYRREGVISDALSPREIG